MQLVSIQLFDPEKTAEAITPMLLELPSSAVFAISKDLDKLLDSSSKGLRSAAIALKVRAGASLAGIAERDPEALFSAIDTLPKEQIPESVSGELLALAEAGQLDAGAAIKQAGELTSDKATLFKRLAGLVDKADEVTYDQWSGKHALAMAALAGMHAVADEAWPAGFNDYRITRAEQTILELGKKTYFLEEKGCVKCHGEHGEGTEGFPPLAGSPNLLGEPVRAATIVKYGLKGELAHTLNPADGKPYNAQMEPLSYFSNAEIAAALTYARQSWGNYAQPVTVEHVAAAKAPEGGLMWDADALLEAYPFERDLLMGSIPGPELKVMNWTPPGAGLLLMLVVVAASMGLILVVTWFGGGPPDAGGAHGTPALA